MPYAALAQDLPQQRGAIAHQPIDADIEQRVHLRGVIDGPDLHMHPACMRGLHEAACDHRDAAPCGGHLH